jgi:hypothetical protein
LNWCQSSGSIGAFWWRSLWINIERALSFGKSDLVSGDVSRVIFRKVWIGFSLDVPALTLIWLVKSETSDTDSRVGVSSHTLSSAFHFLAPFSQ